MEYQHFGVYGIVIKDASILLIRKHGGPYDGMLDLPGGTIEFGETFEDALKSEFKEEVGLEILDMSLLRAQKISADIANNDTLSVLKLYADSGKIFVTDEMKSLNQRIIDKTKIKKVN